MPAAALVKGILLSLGVLAALGFAAYENPEVQQWIDEQRRRLADLLRGIGEELDPQSRREAEAFVHQGRSPPVQSDTEQPTTAETTGASVANTVIRRIPVQGRMSEADTEERQRLGREYLAARNQLLRVMRQRRGESNSPETTRDIEASNTTVESEGVPAEHVDVIKMEDAESSDAPPLPPKVKLEQVEPMPIVESHAESASQVTPTMPGSFEQPASEMSYEEQIALAITLSEEENNLHRASAQSATEAYDADVRKAVQASLQNFSDHMSTHSDPVDLMSTDLPGSALGANVWSTEDDLYNITPNLTKASLAAWDRQPQQSDAAATTTVNPFEHSGFEAESSTTSWTLEGYESAAGEQLHAEDTDGDVVSEGGVVTPDSWTEVGSPPAEEEDEEAEEKPVRQAA